MTAGELHHRTARLLPLLLGIFALLTPVTRSVQDVGFAVVLVLYLVHRYGTGDRIPPLAALRPFYLAAAMFLTVALASLAYSADPLEGCFQFQQLYMLLLVTIFAETTPPHLARRALRLFTAGSSLLALLVLYQGLVRHLDRPPTTMHYVHGGFALLFGAAVLLAFLADSRSRRDRLVIAVLLLLHGGALYLNGTRAAWLGAALVLAVCPFLAPAMTPRRTAAALVVVAAALLVFGSGPYARDKFRQAERDLLLYRAGSEDTSLGGRFAMWRASWRMIRQHPVRGVGLGGWQSTVADLAGAGEVPRFITRYNQPHNMFIEALSTRGPVGLLSLLALLAAPWYIALRCGGRERALFRNTIVLLGLAVIVAGSADTLTRLRVPFMSYIIVTAAALAGLAGRSAAPDPAAAADPPRS